MTLILKDTGQASRKGDTNEAFSSILVSIILERHHTAK
jgi:hypothetical protein